jgi:preprotein translocase subunit Sec61beta
MKMKKSKNQASGPSTAIGIMRFKETAKGIQISPEFIIGLSIAIVVIILVLRTMIRA